MISGFVGPVGFLICRFEYTRSFSKSKEIQNILKHIMSMKFNMLETAHFENVGKGGCRTTPTVNVYNFGKGGCQRKLKLLDGKWWGSKSEVWRFSKKDQHLGTSIDH